MTCRYEFETYKKFSLSFYTVLMGYADELQAVSVDEALIDATSAVAARANAPEEALDDAGESHVNVPAEEVAATEATEDDQAGDEQAVAPAKKRDPAVEIAEKIRDEVRRDTGCEGESPSMPMPVGRIARRHKLMGSKHRNIAQYSPRQAGDPPGQACRRLPPARLGRARLSRTARRGGFPVRRVLHPRTDGGEVRHDNRGRADAPESR